MLSKPRSITCAARRKANGPQRALEYNPGDGRIYAEPAHFFIITRRYREAIELYRKAVEVEPTLWSAHADLAVNLLREGEEQEGRQHLEIAFQGDPYSPQTVNTLRLLDSFKNFKTFSNQDNVALGTKEQMEAALDKPKVILKLQKDEADVLEPYAMDLAERSHRRRSPKNTASSRQRPVQIEMYPNHDDFAVRTMGMPGLGLLGVTFGYVIAMDSPSGRRPGTFHWGTTLVARDGARVYARGDATTSSRAGSPKASRCMRSGKPTRAGASRSRPTSSKPIKEDKAAAGGRSRQGLRAAALSRTRSRSPTSRPAWSAR